MKKLHALINDTIRKEDANELRTLKRTCNLSRRDI